MWNRPDEMANSPTGTGSYVYGPLFILTHIHTEMTSMIGPY
jgi:hypothetical protein